MSKWGAFYKDRPHFSGKPHKYHGHRIGVCEEGGHCFQTVRGTDSTPIIALLARENSQAPSQLKDKVGRTLEGTMKRLASMRSDGLLIVKRDKVDVRRKIYSLAPDVPVKSTEKGIVVDFGFLRVPVKGATGAEEQGVQLGDVRWMPNVVYPALDNSVRRKLLLALARKPLQWGEQLRGEVGHNFDSTLKHLTMLNRAGLLVKVTNENDGRRHLYSISPGIPLQVNENAAVMEFGFCTVTL